MKKQYARGIRFLAGEQPPPDMRSDLTKELLRQTRQLAALERRRRDYQKKVKALTKEIRARKRGLKMLVNRKQFVEGEIEFDSAKVQQ